ncbi:MAG: GDP-fucose synthetase [Gammaproteobacteria bacterium TMED281]|nr:MAG: GDP-fucose synthetase [Gammaproteobacteria bacterium TMED281]
MTCLSKINSVFIAGHKGMVGSAIKRNIEKNFPSLNILVADKESLNLESQKDVKDFFLEHKPEGVFLSAAKVGGISANNTYPADFIERNLLIQTNVIQNAFHSGCKRLIFLGSSCIYPRDCPQPMKEENLLTGILESTNESYAIAKIAGIKLCEAYNRQYETDFRSLMPTNLYGYGDNYDLSSSHVIPALLRKAHEAKINKLQSFKVWGSGKAFREFLFVDDLAEACIHIFNLSKKHVLSQTTLNCSHINVGSGEEISIKNLAELISQIVGYKGEIVFDSSKPDGTKRKLLNLQKINDLGWKSSTTLEEGLKKTYSDFLKRCDEYKNLS